MISGQQKMRRSAVNLELVRDSVAKLAGNAIETSV